MNFNDNNDDEQSDDSKKEDLSIQQKLFNNNIF